jgi:hypothetical protein
MMVSDSSTAAQDTLRGDILAMGRDDFVSMADVQGQMTVVDWPTR